MQCARVRVPRDWNEPDGPSITLALSRAPARQSAQRIGVLFTNFGGPGAPTVSNLAVGQQALPASGSLSVANRFDIIGMDFYWNTQWDSTDPEAAWASMRSRPWGLDWHQAFAHAHGKPTAYSEWGVMSDNAGPYIDHVKDWFDANQVVYASYWDSNAAFPGELSRGEYPDAARAFLADFGP